MPIPYKPIVHTDFILSLTVVQLYRTKNTSDYEVPGYNLTNYLKLFLWSYCSPSCFEFQGEHYPNMSLHLFVLMMVVCRSVL